jgi:hypothetical protein
MLMAIKGIETNKVNPTGLLEISENTTVNHLLEIISKELPKDVSKDNRLKENWIPTVKDLREVTTPDSWIKWNLPMKLAVELRLRIHSEKGFLVVQSLRDSVYYVVDRSDVPKCGSFNPYGNEQMQCSICHSPNNNNRICEIPIDAWLRTLSLLNLSEDLVVDYAEKFKQQDYTLLLQLVITTPNDNDLHNYGIIVGRHRKVILAELEKLNPTNKMEVEEEKEKKRPSPIQIVEREPKIIKRASYTVNSVESFDLNFPGLVSSTEQVPLYFRASSFKLFERLLLPKPIFMVQGPPGSGKSSMTWVWATQLDSVCWIHLDEFTAIVCTYGGEKWQKYEESSKEVVNIVESCQSHNLILDGIVKDQHADLISFAVAKWCGKGKKLVLVCSLQYVVKTETLQYHEVEVFQMPSWIFEEYKDAYSIEDFKKSIKGDIFPEGEDEEKLEDKFFVAGGSARWMFQFTVKDAINDIEIQISRVGMDAQLLLKGLQGERSNTSISHLFCSLSNETFIISEYATRALADKCEASFLTSARNSSLALNPSFDGWILEAEFIFRLRAAEVKVYRDSTASHLPVASKIKFADFPDIKTLPEAFDNAWFIPMRWNQACFDSVQALPDFGFRFIQVTRSKTHTLKKKYVVMFLDHFVKTLSRQVKFFEFWFIVPNHPDYNDFIPKIPEGSYGDYKSLLKMNGKSEYSVVGFDRL